MADDPSAMQPAPGAISHTFRLYVSAASPASARAMVNARKFLDDHLPGVHRLDVLDIARHVAAARADQIFASPTLIRLLPLPQRRLIGDLSDSERMRLTLGLAPLTPRSVA